MTTPESLVEAASLEGTVWVRVIGRGTFGVSPGLKKFIHARLAQGEKRFVIDLLDCEIMDSTFMGTLASFALKIIDMEGGFIEVINANDRTASLLGNLGLSQIFKVRRAGDPEAPHVPGEEHMESAATEGASKSEATDTALSAHEALVEIDSANASRFRDVLDYLREASQENNS